MCRDPHPVGGVVHVEPDLRGLLPGRDEPSHAIGEDLCTAARERPEPDRLELAQHLLVREPGERRHVVDLGRRVALEKDVGKRLVELRDRVPVEVEGDVGVLAVHHVDLGEAGELPLREGVRDELVGGDRVGLLLLLGRRERAELALHAADVRLVQIHVLHEEDAVVPAPHAAGEVGELADGEQVVGLEEREPVVEVETFARLDLCPDPGKRGVDRDRHQEALSTTA